MSDHDHDCDYDEATSREMLRSIGDIMHGKGPCLQGGVLIDLVSRYIAGHNPNIRQQVLEMMVEAIEDMIPAQEGLILADLGVEEWPTRQ